MNLSKLFEMQAKLDAHIEREHPRKENEDRLAKKILALQVELGELCNCWRGFKFWSNDQEPRTKVSDFALWVKNGGEVDEEGKPTNCFKNPLLEEYVDCLHFVLSIGLEIETEQDIFPEPIKYDNTVTQFNELFGQISYFASVLNRDNDWDEVEFEYERVWSLFFGLGGELGFTWDEIEQAYMQKNAENHRRQEVGY